jgi:hypothetical protein
MPKSMFDNLYPLRGVLPQGASVVPAAVP